jgi:hypothetical protein
MGGLMSEFEELWLSAMSEANDRLEALSDEEIERVFNDGNDQ